MSQVKRIPLWSRSIALLVPLAVTGCDDGKDITNHTQSGLSLPGSQFEIDDDANLIADNPALDDWATVDDDKNDDLASGQQDDSYKGGAKENDPCPAVDTGSIPNNKSDLKTFGVYREPGSPGFLHVFWSRVQDPSGTTLMDFEFNQSSEDCGNGVNPVRQAGDLLLEYRLEQGGATATIKVRVWDGTEWGAAVDLTAIGAATGTINHTAIAVADSDGLGSLDARTFGEASIDLDYIFDENSCMSFGSAFVKSRSSDSFNSALKDLIAPTPVNITNCGRVIIRKETDPDGWLDTFGFTHDLDTDPVTSPKTFSLADGESIEFDNVLFRTGYTVTEDVLGAGLELVDIDCSASWGVTPSIDLPGGEVTFDIANDTDVVDCTFTNRAKGTIVVKKVTSDGSGTFNFTSATLSAFSLTTTGAGEPNADSTSFGDLDPGTYDVAESVSPGWTLLSATCDDTSSPAAIDLEAGETVTCTFVNERNRGAIKILKTRKHAASGSGDHGHPGVTFLISGGDLSVPIPVVTDENGEACVDGLLLSSFAGDYTVTEVLPTGYVPDGDLAKSVTVTAAAECPSGDLVTFANTPLTNLSVTVDSQVVGGTASTITCGTVGPVATDPGGDGTLTLSNLLPGTYVCTIVIDP